MISSEFQYYFVNYYIAGINIYWAVNIATNGKILPDIAPQHKENNGM